MTQRDAAGRSETQRGAAQRSGTQTQRDAAGRKGEGVSLPRRVCRALLCAMLVRHARVSEQARKNISPEKNTCDKQASSWRHISCHTDKNRYYT